MSKTKLLVTLLLTTLLTLISITTAFARDGRGDQNNRDGNRSELPKWATNFIGKLTFRLLDDPVFAEEKTNLDRLAKELRTIIDLLGSKMTIQKKTLEDKTKAENDLKTVQTDLRKKEEARISSEQQLKTQIETLKAANADIETSKAIIKLEEGKLASEQTDREFWENEMKDADSQVDIRKTRHANLLKKCQEETPDKDCSMDTNILAAKEALDQAIMRQSNVKKVLTGFLQRKQESEEKIASANETIAKSNEIINTATAEKAKLESAIASINAEIPALNEKITQITQTVTDLTQVLKVVNKEVTELNLIKEQNQKSYNVAESVFQKHEQELIDTVLHFNREGAKVAQDHGAREGIETANKVAIDEADRIGTYEGHVRGESEGRARDYAQGQEVGEREGSLEGQRLGTEAGRIEGEEEGNRIAGERDGEASGIAKANVSDAAQVGTKLGKQQGLDRAITEGLQKGTQIGEDQAIKEMENKKLSDSTVFGPFAGTFSGADLRFPGVYRTYFMNAVKTHREILIKSYKAAYNVTYDNAVANTYFNNVQAIYDEAYSGYFEQARSTAFNQDYDDSRRQGREEQFQVAKDREFGIARENQLPISRSEKLNNPDKGGATYKSSHATSEASAYSRRYGEIKEDSRSQNEVDTFNKNIAGETEKARVNRVAEVRKVYQNFPVLKFSGSSITDAGIDGVASNDSIFQPGESYVRDITLINYGQVAANGMTITLSTGEKANLPSVPALSVVTVKGASKGQLPLKGIGQSLRLGHEINAKLTSEDRKIEGRHFANINSKSLTKENNEVVTLAFPLEVESMGLETALVLNEPNALRMTVKNKSSRAYNGPIEVQLGSTLGNSVIQNGFASINSISERAELSGAGILVTDMNDVMKVLGFDVTLTKNGVVIGRISNAVNEVVKVPFNVKPGQPVVVVKSSSDVSREMSRDLISELGGMEKVAILDVDHSDHVNKSSLKSLDGNTIFVTNDERDQILGSISLVSNNNHSLIVLVNDDRADSINTARNTVQELKQGTLLPLRIAGEKILISSANPAVNKSATTRMTVVEIELDQLFELQKVESLLKLTNDELLEKMASEANFNKIVEKDESAVNLGKILITRNLEEIQAVQNGANLKGKKSDRKDDYKAFKADANSISSKFAAAIKSKSLGHSLYMAPFFNGTLTALEQVSPVNQVDSKLKKYFKGKFKGFLFKNYEKTAAKNLKKALGNKGAYDQIKSVQSSFFPF